MFYLFANWKSYKNLAQAREWFYAFRDNLSEMTVKAMQGNMLSVVVCPPAPLTYPMHTLCLDLPGMTVGIQDISPFSEGKYTGLINASSVAGIVSHAIVGHVEERARGDSPEMVTQKFTQAVQNNIPPVLCISKTEEIISGAHIIAFEPVAAIGTGQNASAADVENFKKELNHRDIVFIYGGSVDEKNCVQYLKPRLVDGFLVGGVSLNAIQFAALANTCASYVET